MKNLNIEQYLKKAESPYQSPGFIGIYKPVEKKQKENNEKK